MQARNTDTVSKYKIIVPVKIFGVLTEMNLKRTA